MANAHVGLDATRPQGEAGPPDPHSTEIDATPGSATPGGERSTGARGDGAAIAYFSMEVALHDKLPTYSGGLGVLAGDFLRSAADIGLPLVGVTLLYRDGYFRQHVDEAGNQSESPVRWSPEDVLEPLEARFAIDVEGRSVTVAAWRIVLEGVAGHEVPVYFLDTAVPENEPADQEITDRLYGGDDRHRLRQEAVLGLAGPAMLEALGHRELRTFHMNEGHASLLTLALLERELAGAGRKPGRAEIAAVRSRCAFTTHTPIPAGHDRFPVSLVAEVLGAERTETLSEIGALEGDELNMTTLGMLLANYVNGVSQRHRRVSAEMFPDVEVVSVTNGVHVTSWAAPSTARLFDRYFPYWRQDNALLRYASEIPLEELGLAHAQAKQLLLDEVRERTGRRLDPAGLTIGLARRATPYKQSALLFSDTERLAAIAQATGPLQVVCASKAHPRDLAGKALIARIVAAAKELSSLVEVVFLENYDLRLGGLLSAGTDVWLNNPMKPHEASGTSGMKAAVNGVPSLSTMDGWWIEGCIEGITGWSIGDAMPSSAEQDATALYDKLENVVAPLFFRAPDSFLEVMRSTISLNGSWFNTERMVREYAVSAYRLGGGMRALG